MNDEDPLSTTKARVEAAIQEADGVLRQVRQTTHSADGPTEPVQDMPVVETLPAEPSDPASN